MIQAAAEGSIDFRQANTLDRRWWLKTKWITNAIARRNRATVLGMQHSQHIGVTDYDTPQLAFDHHWKASNELVMKITEMLLPWIDTTPMSPEEIANRLYARYVEEFGQPGTPEHDEEMNRLIAHWRSGREAA